MPETTKWVLVVDDNRNISSAIVEILEQLGLHAVQSNDGVQALLEFRQIGAENFVGAVIDLMMPQLDGTYIVKEIKKANPAIVTVLCTGYPDMMTNRGWHDAGFDAILSKPFTVEHFKALFFKTIMES